MVETILDLPHQEKVVVEAVEQQPLVLILLMQMLEMVVQVNGKVRAKLTVPANADKQSVETMAREEPNVVRFIEDKTIRKVIVVPGKLVNIVAN